MPGKPGRIFVEETLGSNTRGRLQTQGERSELAAKIVNLKNNIIIADRVILADTFLKRLKGLMFKPNLRERECLIINPCKMIHTFGMRFSLDIIFLSNSNIVLETIKDIRPNHISLYVLESTKVLELPAGTLKATNTVKGDLLKISI